MVSNEPWGRSWGEGSHGFVPRPPQSPPGDLNHIASVLQVEAVIHPQFLADLLSPERERNPLALIEELEQEEGLTFAQVNLGSRTIRSSSLHDSV